MTITTQAELRAALAAAKGGETIALGAIVGPVSIGPLSFDPPVTLKGGSISLTGTPAEYTQLLWLNKVSGLTLDGVAFRGAGERGGQLGWGIRADDCSRLTITGCELTGLHRGMLLTRCADTLVTGNHIHAIRSDGINIAQCDRVTVEENRIVDFTPKAGDHPDGAQLWTTGTQRGSRGIVIRRNLIAGLAGQFPQGVFITDEQALYKAGAGHEDITISDNLIVGSAWHGIMVGAGVTGLKVTDNDVVGTIGAQIDGQQVTPWINLPADAVATGNTAPRYLIGGRDGAIPGNAVGAYVAQAAADTLIDGWMGDAAPEPAPEPDPVEPPPVAPPVPAVDLAALLARGEKMRIEMNAVVNDGRRALYAMDKMLDGLRALA